MPEVPPMTWVMLAGELDGVSFEMHPDKDTLLVLVDRGRWKMSDLTGPVVLYRGNTAPEDALKESVAAVTDQKSDPVPVGALGSDQGKVPASAEGSRSQAGGEPGPDNPPISLWWCAKHDELWFEPADSICSPTEPCTADCRPRDVADHLTSFASWEAWGEWERIRKARS